MDTEQWTLPGVHAVPKRLFKLNYPVHNFPAQLIKIDIIHTLLESFPAERVF